jgi:hypothetical protein
MAIVQAINGVAETYPVKPVTPRAALVDAVDSQARIPATLPWIEQEFRQARE